MQQTANTVQVQVSGGPNLTVPWFSGMNVQQAMEGAYNVSPSNFLYIIQYYGNTLGYYVVMMNETYDTFPSRTSYQPFFYWELLVNGIPSQHGIDSTILNAGDVVTFRYTMYSSSEHANSALQVKHEKNTLAN